ncbi:hypothetical protein R1flu_007898 [Riccia fluitans]|uniref:Uncharacterized protein n=1 Tax=Riccia fluitans TaxID=41844 RepID=A0ABD1Z1D7_9MARC
MFLHHHWSLTVFSSPVVNFETAASGSFPRRQGSRLWKSDRFVSLRRDDVDAIAYSAVNENAYRRPCVVGNQSWHSKYVIVTRGCLTAFHLFLVDSMELRVMISVPR